MQDDTYYKYQPIGPHTGLNLVLLLRKKTLFFPAKQSLNDPTDCEPHLVVPDDKAEVISSLRLLQKSRTIPSFFKEEADQILQELNAAGTSNAGNKASRGFAILMLDPIQKAQLLIKRAMKFEIGVPRIYSMSREWDVGQMWSHYANSHRGICIELSGISAIPPDIILEKVVYTSGRAQILLEDVLSIPSKTRKGAEVLKRLYCQKSNAWAYENEVRLVARDTAALSKACFLSIPDGDFYKIDSLKVVSITFGQHCSEQDLQTIRSLVTMHSPKGQKPKLYQVVQDEESYELGRDALDVQLPFLPIPSLGFGEISPDTGLLNWVLTKSEDARE